MSGSLRPASRRRRRWWSVFALTLGSMILASPSHAQARDDGLELRVDTSYEVRPVEGEVVVTLEVMATNVLDDAEDDFGITRFYFDEVGFALPIEATQVTATDEEGELQVRIVGREQDGIAQVTIALRSRLYSRQARELTIRYVVPSAPPRSTGDVSIDAAHVWLFVWAYGDPGLSTVKVSIPSRFEIDVIGDALRRTGESEGRSILEAGPVDDPPAWVALVSARNDAALKRRRVVMTEGSVEIRSWPSDPAWATDVERAVRSGLPRLAELIGEPWTHDVVITEVIDPALDRHGAASGSIEATEDLDPQRLLHELAHAWLDPSLFAERWVIEGLADVSAAAAVDSVGVDGSSPDPVLRSDPSAIPLNDWGAAVSGQWPPNATEQYAAAASWHVVSAVVDEIGFDSLQEVIEAARSNTTAYRGEVVLDFVPGRDDWRRFLDLLEEVGGSTRAEDLFATWVVDEDETAALDQRRDARIAYAELRSEAGHWALPADLRRAMSEWEFDSAQRLIAESARVIAARDAGAVVANRAGLIPESLESRFEAGEDAGVLVAEIEAQSAVAVDVLGALEAVGADRSTLQTIGLIGSDLSSDLGNARQAFAIGDLAESRTSAMAVVDAMSGAEERGRVRTLVGALVLILALGSADLVRRRKRIRRTLGDGAHAALRRGENAPR